MTNEADTPDYQAILDEIRDEVRPLLTRGKVADYIPRLAHIRREKFGMAVVTLDGQVFQTGDALDPFRSRVFPRSTR